MKCSHEWRPVRIDQGGDVNPELFVCIRCGEDPPKETADWLEEMYRCA